MPASTKSPVDRKSMKTSRKTPPSAAQAPAKAGTVQEPKKSSTAVITSEERHLLIAEAAYYLAEKRGFQGGSPEQDWFEAANQVDNMFISSGKGRNM